MKGIFKENHNSLSGIYKINIDGAVFSLLNFFGVGAMVMVNQGRVIATLSRWEQPVHDAETIEAIATVHALSFTKMIDIDEVVLKYDSLLNYNESIAIERTY